MMEAPIAYKDPRANMKITASLFLKLSERLPSSGMGSKIMTISSKMLRPAPAETMAPALIHFPFVPMSQTALTGMHWKTIAMENAKALQASHARHIFVKSRKRWLGKIRRKSKRMEALAKFFTKV